MRAIIIVVVGLVLLVVGAVVSIILVQRLNIPQRNQSSESDVVKTQVVVMTRDMFLGDKLEAADVKLVEVPIDLAPRGALTSLDAVIGKIIKADLVAGEMILQHNLADPTNSNHDLSFIISEEHVLMAFPADDLISREGIIQRGDVVDIFATFQEVVKTVPDGTDAAAGTQNGAEEPTMRTFTVDTFQKVSVTALVLEVVEEVNNDPNAQPPAPKIRSYLFALNPQDALVLKHLKDTGAVFDMVLRAPTSSIQFPLTPVTEDYIVEYYGLEILP